MKSVHSFYKGESILGYLSNLILGEIHLFFFDMMCTFTASVMRIDQHSSGAINQELKKVKLIKMKTLVRFFSIDSFLNCPHDFFVGPEMTFIDILLQV